MAKSMLSGNTVIKAANTKITELTTPSQNIAEGLIVIIDPKDPSNYEQAYVGQPETDEQLFGVDAKGNLSQQLA